MEEVLAESSSEAVVDDDAGEALGPEPWEERGMRKF